MVEQWNSVKGGKKQEVKKRQEDKADMKQKDVLSDEKISPRSIQRGTVSANDEKRIPEREKSGKEYSDESARFLFASHNS